MLFVHVPPGHSSCEKVPFHSCPSTCITVSGLPLFIPNEELEHELRHCGKFVCGIQTLSLGCWDTKMKHVQSLRRQVCMFLEVSFCVKHEDGFYMVYASSGTIE